MSAIELLTRQDFGATAAAPPTAAATDAAPPGLQFGDVLSNSIDATKGSGSYSENGQPGNLQSGAAQTASVQPGGPLSGSTQPANIPSGSEQSANDPLGSGQSPSKNDPSRRGDAQPPQQNSDPAAAPSAGNGAPTDQQSLLAASLSGANRAAAGQSPPVNSAASSGSKDAKLLPQTVAVPGAAPAQLVSNLLQAAAATGTPQAAQSQTHAAPGAQSDDVNIVQAPIAGQRQAAGLPVGQSKSAPPVQSALDTPTSDVGQKPPANSTGASSTITDKPALQSAAVPGADPTQLVSNLLQGDAATGNTANAATTDAPQAAQAQSSAVPGAQSGDVNARQAQIAGVQQAARLPAGQSNLTPLVQSALGTPAGDVGQNSTPAGAEVAPPPATPATPSAAASLADSAHAGELVPLIQTATSSSTSQVATTSSGVTLPGAGQTNAGDGTVSPVLQVALVSTGAASDSSNSQTLVLSMSTSSSDVAKAQQPGAVTLVGNSFAGNVLRQSDLSKPASADFSTGTVAASTNLATISPVATNVLPSVPATGATSAPDKSDLARISNTNETGQAASQPGTQNAGSLQFGAAPPSLQLHSTSFTVGQPGPAASLNASQMIDQVAYAVQYSHANGQQMQLHLNPPELGALSVDVSMHDGVLSARIEAQTPTARQILVDNISQLKDSLTQQGVSFDRIDVHLAGSNWGSGGSSTANNSFAQQQDGALPWDQQLVPPESDESATRKPAMITRDSRLALTTLDIMI